MTVPYTLVMDLVGAYVESDRTRVESIGTAISDSGHIDDLHEVINAFATTLLTENSDLIAALPPGRLQAAILDCLAVLPPNEDLDSELIIDHIRSDRIDEAFTRALGTGDGVAAIHLTAAWVAAVGALSITEPR
ncbi:hypothetical protein [Nocardia sp. NPDC057668]|uniref:hypothetical protein n=1 Tax=Nocardia sp. NPDC057668 TaxID=3346202 RepID=UPI00366E8074